MNINKADSSERAQRICSLSVSYFQPENSPSAVMFYAPQRHSPNHFSSTIIVLRIDAICTQQRTIYVCMYSVVL